MGAPEISLVPLLEQVRNDFDRIRFECGPVAAMVTHRATNAEAEGVKGHPRPRGEVVAFSTLGHREGGMRVDKDGNPMFRADPVVDVNGTPIVNSAGSAFDYVMPAHRAAEFTGQSSDYEKLDSAAQRAGRILMKMSAFPSRDLLVGWRFMGPAQSWWGFIFEIAWTDRHPLVTAKRQIWAPSDNPTSFYPYDLVALQRLAEFPIGATKSLPQDWLKRLPDAFVSDLDNLAAASFDVADYLLRELPTGSGMAPNDSPKTLSPSIVSPTAEVATPHRFAVALSFPGEHRAIVDQVAHALGDALDRPRVFYDRFHEVELCRPNLDLLLQQFYRDDSDLVVVFVCGEYAEKDWCGIEWRAIRELLKCRTLDDRRVMFLRLDNKPLPGLLSLDGFLRVEDKSPRQIADAILRRWSVLK